MNIKYFLLMVTLLPGMYTPTNAQDISGDFWERLQSTFTDFVYDIQNNPVIKEVLRFHILFDNMDRLAEINIKMKDDISFGSEGGKLEFFYESCEVMLPVAKEVKQPGQDLSLKGLSP